MLAELKDPNTRLVSPREWSAIQDLEQGNLHSLGAVLTVRTYAEDTGTGPKPAPVTVPSPRGGAAPNQERNITVVSVLPGSAAEKAGLQPGDRITYLDGHWIAPIHLSFRELSSLEDDLGPQDGRPLPADDLPENNPDDNETRQKQRKQLEEIRRRWISSTEMAAALDTLQAGKPGEHELTVRSGNAAPRQVKVTLAEGHTDLFATRKINPNTGYIRLDAITPATVKEVERALADFGHGGVSNLVLDLRESPGGSLDGVREIVGAIAPGATVLVSHERDASRKLVDRKVAAPRGTPRLHPSAISVLVDHGTAGASEVLAAALRDDLGARLVGDTTFGDGAEQDFVSLPNGSAVSITHAHMLTPKGVDFDGKGLKPDLPGGPGDAGIDAAVRALAPARSAARGGR
jgi:carboxyl-terminal processing protease